MSFCLVLHLQQQKTVNPWGKKSVLGEHFGFLSHNFSSAKESYGPCELRELADVSVLLDYISTMFQDIFSLTDSYFLSFHL